MVRKAAEAGSDASLSRVNLLVSDLCDLLARYLVSSRESRDRLAESFDDPAYELPPLLNLLLMADADERERAIAETLEFGDDNI